MAILVGLDIGTTTIKAVLYDADEGILVGSATRLTPVEHPQPDWSQYAPQRLWQTIADCLREVAAGQEIRALGISSLAEAGLPLSENGTPLYPIIAWYDRRGETQARWWESQLSIPDLHAITGQRVSPSFGVNKFLWIREKHPDLASRMACWLSVPDYVLLCLTGVKATDYTIASRTMLFDQRKLTWSEEMLGLAGLRAEQLPEVYPSGTLVGYVTEHAAAETGLPVGMPCLLGGHDHLCAALAAGGYQAGSVIDSSGTAEATLMVLNGFHSSSILAEQAYALYGHVIPGLYVLKAGLKASGGAIEWLARLLNGSVEELDQQTYFKLEQEAAAGIGKQIGPLWLPHLIGSGTPEGDRYSRAALVGIQIEHTRGDLFRGLLESLAFWLRHNLDVVRKLIEQPVQQVVLLGGTTRLELLVQLKADVLNMPVQVCGLPEASPIGAALLAGMGVGIFRSPAEAVSSLKYTNRVLQPIPERVDWYGRIYEQVYRTLYPSLQEVHHRMEGFE
jgi:xylulokinase